MGFIIRCDLHYCEIEDSFVFLDLQYDRYFLLKGGGAARFRRFLEGEANPQSIAWLADRNIIEEGARTANLGCPSIPPPDSSFAEGKLERPSPMLVAEAVVTQLTAKRCLRRQPLLSILRTCAIRKKRAALREGGPYHANVGAAFRYANRFISTTDQCLSRGLAAMQMLTRRRCAASLVIGVTKPFSAHCWVQHGNIVLTDPLDRVRSFHPILVI